MTIKKKLQASARPLYRASDYSRQSKIGNNRDYRSAFRRDYARLLHSPAFRRLQGKTQLFPEFESDFFRNRLTHSLEVAQIAKSISVRINGEHPYFKKNPIDPDLVEFAGLAHDLGHPPFGHNGEIALDHCMKKHGGFEGNAQTLRIVARLEKKDILGSGPSPISKRGNDLRLGLNPTFRTLAAVLKYDRPIPARRSLSASVAKGYFPSEAPLVREIKKNVCGKSSIRGFKTIECSIMDLADDIAYSTYDLEDTFKSGLLDPLSIISKIESDLDLQTELIAEVRKGLRKAGIPTKVVSARQVFEALVSVFGEYVPPNEDPMATFINSDNLAKNGYLRTEFSSSLVRKAVDGVQIEFNQACPALSGVYLETKNKIRVETLKQISYLMVIRSNRMAVAEYRGSEIVGDLFKILSDEAKRGSSLLPSDVRLLYQRMRTETKRKRVICDFIAGMTDSYALDFYNRLTGDTNTIFKPI